MNQRYNILKIKATKRSNQCILCRGNSGIITKYKLYMCRHCFRQNYQNLGWIRDKK